MPDVASVLKQEIARIARKEVTAATKQHAKQIRALRSTVRDLREQVASQNKTISRLSREASKQRTTVAEEQETSPSIRISPASIRKHRQRLGLSQAELAQLLSVSSATVTFWETGRTKPQGDNRSAIASMRSMGVREARAMLESLGG